MLRVPHCEPALTGQPPNESNDHLQNHLLQTTVALQNHLLQNQDDDHLQNQLLQMSAARLPATTPKRRCS